MKVFRDSFSPEDFVHPVVTIGSFDGIHLGHQALIHRIKREALRVKGEAIVFTFEPHPSKVLFPDRPVRLITPFKDKLRILENLGVDGTIAFPFTAELAAKSPEAFVQEVLWGMVRPVKVVVGFNFTFGKGRTGTAETLRDLGTLFGFDVDVIEALKGDGGAVSSSRIRELILAGKVDEASQLLGRRFSFRGRVIPGDRRGRKLGFPTANLEVDPDQILPPGVFAVWVEGPSSQPLPGVLNVGRRPTFEGQDLSVEVHLIDFQGDLYSAELKVEVVSKLRDELPFASPEALAEQIAQDIEAASKILKEPKG